MTIANYILDLDGTIINSKEEIVSCIKLACEKLNVSINEALLNDLIGAPIKTILQKSLDSQSQKYCNEIIKEYRKIYDYKESYSCHLYNGALEFLKELKANNKNIYILTNKPLLPTLKVLDFLKIKQYFNDIYTIDKIENLKTKDEILSFILKERNISSYNTALIGDTINDMIAAKRNNILAISALWGYEKDKNRLIANSDLNLKCLISEEIFEDFDKFNNLRIKSMSLQGKL